MQWKLILGNALDNSLIFLSATSCYSFLFLEQNPAIPRQLLLDDFLDDNELCHIEQTNDAKDPSNHSITEAISGCHLSIQASKTHIIDNLIEQARKRPPTADTSTVSRAERGLCPEAKRTAMSFAKVLETREEEQKTQVGLWDNLTEGDNFTQVCFVNRSSGEPSDSSTLMTENRSPVFSATYPKASTTESLSAISAEAADSSNNHSAVNSAISALNITKSFILPSTRICRSLFPHPQAESVAEKVTHGYPISPKVDCKKHGSVGLLVPSSPESGRLNYPFFP
ncbi:unnamed protein product [Protopolystoma xenopodis]|uniref:Uncharacterized protein n=1 Tax=Protopolystoma xenopodis TaxID=117903 RepID=A0A448X0Q0_9PLAT|nr:unnamed protein product [Protopolystoma xenopodis]